MPSPENPETMLELTINGEVVYAHRNNTALFTFLGSQAIDGVETDISIYDHVFVATEDAEEGYIGKYIFKADPDVPEAYENITDFIASSKWPQHVNMNAVQGCDVSAFNQRMYRDSDPTHVPDAWTDQEIE